MGLAWYRLNSFDFHSQDNKTLKAFHHRDAEDTEKNSLFICAAGAANKKTLCPLCLCGERLLSFHYAGNKKTITNHG
jgi:hypothetical protein